MKKLITKLRKSAKVSQAKLAKELGISRPTLIAIEKGERDVTLTELKKISRVFDVPLSILLDEEMDVEEKVESTNFSKKALSRFHNLILQVIKYASDDDGKITKTKLAKLVYLCDFACYYKFLNPISGFKYYKLSQGPVAIEFFDAIDAIESINVEVKGRAIMISSLEKPSDSVFKKEELGLIKTICKKWKSANTRELVDFTHDQIPWRICREHEVIPYSLINNEEPENVY